MRREPGDLGIDKSADVSRTVEIIHFLHRLDEITDGGRLNRAPMIEDMKLAVIIIGGFHVGAAQIRFFGQDIDRFAPVDVLIEPVDPLGHSAEKAEQQRLMRVAQVMLAA